MAIQFKNLVDVFEQRTGAIATDAYTLTVSTEQTSGATPNPGTGGLKVQYYSVSSGTTHGFGLVAGTSSSDFLTSGPMHFYTNSDLDTKNATGFAMVLDTNQRLGIGTTTPTSKLQVNTGTDINAQIGLDSFGSFKLGDVSGNYTGRGVYYDGFPGSEDLNVITSTFRISGNSGEGIKVDSSGDVQLSNAFGVVLTIDSTNSNVGIGTTNPNAKLDVDGKIRIGDAFTPSATTNYGNILNLIAGANNNGQTNGITFHENTSGFGMKLGYDGTGQGATNAIRVYNDQDNSIFSFQNGGNLGVGIDAPLAKLDVSGKTFIREGLVVSPFPNNVQVDNSSVVIGAGNNDIVSGSDHCLTVGNNNQILSDSDRSVSFGNSNTTRESNNTLVAGTGNALENSSNSHVIGSNNQGGDLYVGQSANIEIGINSSAVIGSDNKALGRVNPSNNTRLNSGLIFIIGHDNDATAANTNSFMFGYNISNTTPSDPENNYHQNDFSIGGDLTMVDKTMTLGYRNDASSYPAENNTAGLGATKFVVATGSSTTSNANAILITEGGINKSNTAQVPRIVLPSVVGFNFANDAAAATGGIPVGGLYHSSGTLKIRLT